ncbi:lysostaphin resistance A-like protein [Solilutibacter silvestris]|uniref:CPBP family intramembrane glutamic endopeptidase n=1 Tax=Solilutibacter silvestris TaxID=1645665 RepID=UPI003D3505C6
MIGPLLLVITWILLRFEGRGLGAIGLNRWKRRTVEFAVGLVLMAGAATLQQLCAALSADDRFVFNTALTLGRLGDGVRFVVNSVLYEELLFRGYLLFQAIRWLGPGRAVALDAVVFGAYHWFSYGVLGNPVAMAYVFALTGAFGFMLARSFVATGSVAAPVGLHLGWNAAVQLLFSTGPLGAMVLIPSSGAAKMHASGAWSLVISLLFPLAVVAMVVLLCRRYERTRSIPADALGQRAQDPARLDRSSSIGEI